ncbi:acanthoscurrin-1-like isoform X2 [Anthonomus grandis grandis]|uniref:acanthoscurrin-1-like isoform X2 n=1 Tax=Anthonomus grandis grandis TaxID=2921223 RepID=UPI0021669F71|nr:acanthoscurrin-1-like isoform X2 [Anthonomus grandis grandis]
MKFLVVATLAFAASVHGGGIILKGPSGVITPHGPIGPDGRGAGNAGGWNGGWNGAGAGWGGHGDGIILKGPSGAITKNGPIGPDALGLGAWNNGGWGGDDGQWHGHGAWNNGGWGGDDGQWHGDNGAWNGGWGGDDDGQWHGDNGAWNGGWGGDDGQWHGEGGYVQRPSVPSRWNLPPITRLVAPRQYTSRNVPDDLRVRSFQGLVSRGRSGNNRILERSRFSNRLQAIQGYRGYETLPINLPPITKIW